jgi:outer membrane protein OmpA-like peptidoglycan-associated protein
MNDSSDEHQNLVLGIVFAIIAAVVAGSIVLAASRGLGKAPAAKPVAAMPAAAGAAPMAEPPAPMGAALDKLYFDVGSASLPANANEVLAKVSDAARAGSQMVLISGFHDASGDPAKNAELAKQRALAVKHALEANGVAPERLVMSRPAQTTGGSDPMEARRVELRLQ